jgi:hypothetical protein
VIDIALQMVGPAPAPPPPAAPAPPITQPPPGATGPPTPQPTGGGPSNLTGLDNVTLLNTGNFYLEHSGMGDARPYADEAIRRMNARTLSSNDPHWDMVPSFKAYVTRDYFGFLKVAS